MESFYYKAKRGLTEVVEGTIAAETQEDALNAIIAKGLYPLFIDKEGHTRPAPAKTNFSENKWRSFFFKQKKKLTTRDRFLFTRKLATLIRSKVELLSALKILYEQTEEPGLKEIIQQLYSAIKEGNSFSESLRRFPGLFSVFYVSMVKAGETSGRLDLTLDQISKFLERQEKLKTQIITALAYPVLLICVGFISVLVLLGFVIPKLSPVLRGLGKELPLITGFILSLSEFLGKYCLLLAVALAGVIVLLAWQRKSVFISRIGAFLRKHIPIVKDLLMNEELANFSWSLSLLLRSGINLYQALQIATMNIRDARIIRQLDSVCDRLRYGEALSKSLQQQQALPQFFVKMIAIGEESGRLTDVLTETSESYAQDVETAIALISSLLEPVLILIVGIVLGVIVFSLMFPLFQVSSMIH